MKTLPLVVAALIGFASAPAFAGWSGHGTAYTPHGTYSGAHYGSCGGACQADPMDQGRRRRVDCDKGCYRSVR